MLLGWVGVSTSASGNKSCPGFTGKPREALAYLGCVGTVPPYRVKPGILSNEVKQGTPLSSFDQCGAAA
jgi:hypothetical protein